MPCMLHHFSKGLSRRQALGTMGGAGLGLLCSGSAMAGLFPEGALINEISHSFKAAGGEKLGEIIPFKITGRDLPWQQKLMQVKRGQEVTFLLGGRWHFSREADLWLEPGVVFHARVDGRGMYNPSHNTGTMVADADGRIEIARAAGEWRNAKGELWTPEEQYLAGDGVIEGVAIAWKTDPLRGLKAMARQGDPGGLLSREYHRLQQPALTPHGWHNHFDFGEAGVFQQHHRHDGPEMCCDTHKNVAILQRDVIRPLSQDLSLSWQWLVDELPSQVGENSAASHDYLSIGVEFDDGQDITYLWSSQLPVGQAFRCPLPGWDKVETHVVQRSGLADLGKWLPETRNITEDYKTLIGGEARHMVRVWLLGVSVFQRRRGACCYRDIVVSDHKARQTLLT